MTAGNACVAGDGRALLLGPDPALLHRDGRQESVTDLRHGGTCALASGGGIVAELAQTLGGGHRARVRAFDGNRKVVWTADETGAVAVTADPTTPRAAVVANGTLREVDLRSGRTARSLPGVLAARYDGSGSLVVVEAGGAPRWLPAAAG